MDWVEKTARWNENHLSFGIWCNLYWRFYGICISKPGGSDNGLTFYHQAIFWIHDDVKWKHFPRHWPYVWGIHQSTVNSPHKGQWRGALMFPLICTWMNAWVNNREAGDSRRLHAHNDVIVMQCWLTVDWTLGPILSWPQLPSSF